MGNENAGSLAMDLETNKANLSEKETQLSKANENAGSLAMDLETIQANLSEKETQLSKANENADSLAMDLETIKAKLSEKETQLSEANENADSLAMNLKTIKANLSEKETALNVQLMRDGAISLEGWQDTLSELKQELVETFPVADTSALTGITDIDEVPDSLQTFKAENDLGEDFDSYFKETIVPELEEAGLTSTPWGDVDVDSYALSGHMSSHVEPQMTRENADSIIDMAGKVRELADSNLDFVSGLRFR